MKRLKGSLKIADRIKKIILSMFPEEKENWIPCVAFGGAMLVLVGLNIWKWVVR